MPSLLRLKRFLERVRYEWLEGAPPFRISLEQGRQAAAAGDWAAAIRFLELAVKARPSAVSAHVKLGRAYGAVGRYDLAEKALRAAFSTGRASIEAKLMLAHQLRLMGRDEEALLLYDDVRKSAPDQTSRERYKLELSNDYSVQAALSAQLATRHREERRLKGEEWRDSYSLDAWAEFRSTRSRNAPSTPKDDEDIILVVEARQLEPSRIRSMLISLQCLNDPRWRAFVIADAGVENHPVGSFEKVDHRIVFSDPAALKSLAGQRGIFVDRNCHPEPESLDWFRYLLNSAQADVIYGDYDHHVIYWREARINAEPVLAPAFGRYDLASTPAPPNMLFLRDLATLSGRLDVRVQDVSRRIVLGVDESGGAIAHVPIVLSSAAASSASGDLPINSSKKTVGSDDAGILVVIPTRDNGDVLEKAIISFYSKALNPSRVSVVVMDNCSSEKNTFDIINSLTDRYGIKVHRVDEAFNWSRLNNVGASIGSQEILVFANNDLQILSHGWDAEVQDLLGDQSVGAVGARLLYPDDSFQHVGVALGAIAGRPIHEGRAVHASDAGYLQRWNRTREAGAVTGAFLATRRKTYEAAGGFNESLAVAYNDLDFCLRVRALGLCVLYAPAVEAIHFESKTRGLANTEEKVAWDDSEFLTLLGIWGDYVLNDPYINPHFIFDDQSKFAGYKSPSLAQILSSLSPGLRVKQGSVLAGGIKVV